jgi:LmbE family N-acetylglucosaminyl deacetylase
VFPGLSLGEQPRLLLVVAHPDDETFGCGTVLLRAAAEGAVTAVCCATRGEAGEPSVGVVVGDGELGTVREAELRAAAELLGVHEVHLLGFGDSGMAGHPGPGTLAAALADQVDAAVRHVAEQFVPDVLLTLDASDGHRDHRVVRDATVRLAEERGLPAYLQCLPRSLMARWVEHMVSTQPDLEHLALGELGTPDSEIDVVLDGKAYLEDRERAIGLHRSQTSPFEGLPAELRRSFLAADHLRRVR